MAETISISVMNLYVRFDFSPQGHPSEPPESIEILEVYTGNCKLGTGSQQALLNDVYIEYNPPEKKDEAGEYSVEDIIKFEIWDHIKEQKADKQFEEG